MGKILLINTLILIVFLIFIHMTRGIEDYLDDEYAPIKRPKSSEDEDYSSDESQDYAEDSQLTDVSIRFEQLGWKVLCDDDEWRQQFKKVRQNLTTCLELSGILLPEDRESDDEKRKRDWSFMFSDGKSNPYCRMSRNWLGCYQMLEPLNCLQADAKTLEKKKGGSPLSASFEKKLPKYKNPDDWISMHRPYKLHCFLSKAAFGASPFGPFGAGLWF